MDGQTHLYRLLSCPREEAGSALSTLFVSARFLSKNVTYAISITCHILSLFSFSLSLPRLPPLFQFHALQYMYMLTARPRAAPCLFIASGECETEKKKKRIGHYARLKIYVVYVYVKVRAKLERVIPHVKIYTAKLHTFADLFFILKFVLLKYMYICLNLKKTNIFHSLSRLNFKMQYFRNTLYVHTLTKL